MEFIPGQHINVGLPGEDERPYSLYNGIADEHLEILVKEVLNGNISRKLKRVEPGEQITVDKPTGDFTIETERKELLPFWFISTGTGISPFHSFVRSYPDLNYRIIHGIRFGHESYERQSYSTGVYISCSSRDLNGDYNGRVTEYLKTVNIDPLAYYYMCGSYEMIDQVFDLLILKGTSKNQIKAEGYF
jgi:ferredoxin--NADP+ reductase/benzoate/toluate 1,2-dioxygenase reductase subunit